MPARAEVLRDRPIGGAEPLGLSWGCEPLPPSVPLSGRPVRILRAIIHIAMPPVCDTRQYLALRRSS
jgi:hypothetical protein